MSKLEELVPDIKLCKLIPQGEFADSYAVYIQTTVERDNVVLGNWVTESSVETSPVTPRDRATAVVDFLETEYKFIPAPTLEEIMAELKRDYCKVGVSIRYDWCCYVVDDLGNDMTESDNSDAVAVALKLWFKLKGIVYEEE